MASELVAGEYFARTKPADPIVGSAAAIGTPTNPHRVVNYVWNTDTLAYELATAGGSGTASSVSVTNFPATQAISASALPLPAGASTATKQDTGNTSLASIDTKTPSLMSAAPVSDSGQSAIPVRIISQLGAGTGGGGGASTIADGADVTQGAKADTAWDGAAAAPTQQGILKYLGAKLEAVRALLAGTLTIGGAVSVSNLPAIQAVSGTVTVVDSVPLSVSGTVTANTGLTQPLTDTQLRATAVPISAATLPLPANASTSALQTTGNTSVASIDTKTPALGQALAAASMPVVLPAAQVTTLTPPAAITGFALEAGHLAAIDTSTAKIPAQGQALAAASMPVVLPAAQITTLTPPAAITGFALEAGHLAAIDTSTAKIPAQGQALAAASMPVVLPAAQITTLTPPAAITGFALEAGHLAAIDTHLDVALSTRLKAADTLAGVTTVAAVTAITNALPAGTNKIGTVDIATAPAVAKGTQGANGVPTQDLKDSGRSARVILLDSFSVAATAETIMTMSYSSDNATLTTGTSYNVTAGKRFRMQAIVANMHTITGNTTAVNVIIRIRVNNAGAGIVSSPIQFVVALQGIATANQAGIPQDISIPDGWEFVGNAGIAITVACAGFVATTAAPKIDITIIGYEY